MDKVAKIRKVLKLLKRAYGPPAPRSKSNAIDELVRTILSQNTNDRNSLGAFAALKSRFGSWDELLATATGRIAATIKHAGLANIKAKRIKGVLAEIKRREGALTLVRLKDASVADALTYLRSLKGVGPKTAACVLLFSFNKPAMPVDTHIFRVTKRLGLVDRNVDIEEAHKALSQLVPKHLIYEFHLGIIKHGRRTCKAQDPRCGFCVLYRLCKFTHKAIFRKRGLKGDKKS